MLDSLLDVECFASCHSNVSLKESKVREWRVVDVACGWYVRKIENLGALLSLLLEKESRPQ